MRKVSRRQDRRQSAPVPLWALAIVVAASPAWLAVAQAARAAPPAPAAGATGGQTADQLIVAAIAQRRAGHDDAALPLLQRAYARSHAPRAAAQLGFVEQALGFWAGAE